MSACVALCCEGCQLSLAVEPDRVPEEPAAELVDATERDLGVGRPPRAQLNVRAIAGRALSGGRGYLNWNEFG